MVKRVGSCGKVIQFKNLFMRFKIINHKMLLHSSKNNVVFFGYSVSISEYFNRTLLYQVYQINSGNQLGMFSNLII